MLHACSISITPFINRGRNSSCPLMIAVSIYIYQTVNKSCYKTYCWFRWIIFSDDEKYRMNLSAQRPTKKGIRSLWLPQLTTESKSYPSIVIPEILIPELSKLVQFDSLGGFGGRFCWRGTHVAVLTWSSSHVALTWHLCSIKIKKYMRGLFIIHTKIVRPTDMWVPHVILSLSLLPPPSPPFSISPSFSSCVGSGVRIGGGDGGRGPERRRRRAMADGWSSSGGQAADGVADPEAAAVACRSGPRSELLCQKNGKFENVKSEHPL